MSTEVAVADIEPPPLVPRPRDDDDDDDDDDEASVEVLDVDSGEVTRAAAVAVVPEIVRVALARERVHCRRLREIAVAKAQEERDRVTDELLAGLICPITQALPVDPVFAEDGRIYERAAIARAIVGRGDLATLVSPITTEKMGVNLVSAPQVFSHIETFVDSGMLGPVTCAVWRDGVWVKDRLSHIAQGDGKAMYLYAEALHYGWHGVEKDRALASKYFLDAHEAGHGAASYYIGREYYKSYKYKEDDEDGNEPSANEMKNRLAKAVYYLTSASNVDGAKRKLREIFSVGGEVPLPREAKRLRIQLGEREED